MIAQIYLDQADRPHLNFTPEPGEPLPLFKDAPELHWAVGPGVIVVGLGDGTAFAMTHFHVGQAAGAVIRHLESPELTVEVLGQPIPFKRPHPVWLGYMPLWRPPSSS